MLSTRRLSRNSNKNILEECPENPPIIFYAIRAKQDHKGRYPFENFEKGWYVSTGSLKPSFKDAKLFASEKKASRFLAGFRYKNFDKKAFEIVLVLVKEPSA